MLMFQSCTWASLELDSISNFYVDMHLSTAPTFLPATQCLPEKATWLFVLYLSLSERLVPTYDYSLTQVSPVSVPAYQYLSFPEFVSSASCHSLRSKRLPDSHCHVITDVEISSNVALICFWATVFHYHVSQCLPPSSYPVLLEQTSSISLNDYH